MRTGAAAGHHGYFHEAALYDSDDEFLSIVIPFLEGGAEAGEPTVVALGVTNTKLVRAAMGNTSNISFMDASAHYNRPASAIKSYRELLAAHVARGAQQIRVAGEVPHPGLGKRWEKWARYEAVINHAFDDFPVWGLCPYDARITPDDVLADVARTHPYLATTDGQHVPNTRFEDPADFLTRRPPAGADPLETSPPITELVDPTPAAARRSVRSAARASRLDPDELECLVFAVSEAVTNAFYHGQPPVCLRLWVGPDRLVATVTDQGHGPINPFVGLLPTTNSRSGGLGLWMTHQMCSHVTLGRSDEGFTVRVVAGDRASQPD
ncbi:MAG: anti-sigma factor RsbA family regulatory protein [Pseudonocardiaceae bacterium]